MRKFVCLSVKSEELWLTAGKIYEAEDEEINKYFPAVDWIKIKRADDGHPCYVRKEQFKRVE